MDRVEHYLERILKNPGYWIRISKRKEHNLSKNSKFKERQMVIEQVAAALDLMGIKYERLNGSKFRIPLPRHDMSVRAIMTGRGAYQITGKKPHLIIIDDITETK